MCHAGTVSTNAAKETSNPMKYSAPYKNLSGLMCAKKPSATYIHTKTIKFSGAEKATKLLIIKKNVPNQLDPTTSFLGMENELKKKSRAENIVVATPICKTKTLKPTLVINSKIDSIGINRNS